MFSGEVIKTFFPGFLRTLSRGGTSGRHDIDYAVAAFGGNRDISWRARRISSLLRISSALSERVEIAVDRAPECD